MFDNVQQHISIFRCDYCSELLSISGKESELKEHMVYLVTENPRMYMKHYDPDEALHMDWLVCCADCRSNEMTKDLLAPANLIIKMFNPYQKASTYSRLNELMEQWQVTPHLKSSIMMKAHFVGDKPVV